MSDLTTPARPPLDDAKRFLDQLWQPGDVREFRAPKHNRYGNTASGYFNAPEKLAAAAAKWDRRANLYVTLNPVNPALLARANNRIEEKAEHTTADTDSGPSGVGPPMPAWRAPSVSEPYPYSP